MQLLHGADEYFWSAPGAVQPDAEETSREALAGPAVGDACGCQVRLGLFVCCVQADTLPLPAAVSRLTACSAPGAVAVQAILSSVIVVRAGPLLLA